MRMTHGNVFVPLDLFVFFQERIILPESYILLEFIQKRILQLGIVRKICNVL